MFASPPKKTIHHHFALNFQQNKNLPDISS